MWQLALSMIGSASLGGILKVVGTFIGERIKEKERQQRFQHERDMAYMDKAIRHFNHADDHTKWTRRVLAIMFTSTFCAIMLLCTIYPGAEWRVLALKPSPGTTEILWGLISWSTTPNMEDYTVTLSSGAIVWAGLDLLALVLGSYFTPISRR